MESKSETSAENCEICNINKRIYACPRCNIQYCSVNCYKSVSHIQCSEPFYEQWVQDEVASMGGDSEASKKMADILRKMREMEGEDEAEEDEDNNAEIDSDDDDSDDSIDRRFAEVNLEDGEEIWNSLTDQERKKFVKMIGDGQILKVVPGWSPWWASGGNGLPEMAQNISSLSQLTRASPSPNLPAIVMNTLSSYLVTCRLLKGEVHGFCVEASTAIWNLSSTLRGGADAAVACTTFADANRLLEEEIATRKDWFVSSGFQFDGALLEKDLDDLRKHGSTYVLLALSDILSVMQEAKEALKTSKSLQRFTGAPPTRQVLKMVEKKITFYIAWAKETNPQVWDGGELIVDLGDE